jgi:hypothetical protein
VGLVDAFQNDLAQAFLPLGREQQPLDERPSVRPGGAEQAGHEAPVHARNGVFTGAGLDERVEGRIPDRPTRVDRAG